MSDLDFLDEISAKLHELSKLREVKLANVMDGDWHTKEVTTAIRAALSQVDDLPESSVAPALRSIIEQIPAFVNSLWKNSVDDIQKLDGEIGRWKEMRSMYQKFVNDKQEAAKVRQELAKSVQEGEIDEPSTRTGMRRETGERPPITLKDFRNLSLSDSEQKTSGPDGS